MPDAPEGASPFASSAAARRSESAAASSSRFSSCAAAASVRLTASGAVRYPSRRVTLARRRVELVENFTLDGGGRFGPRESAASSARPEANSSGVMTPSPSLSNF